MGACKLTTAAPSPDPTAAPPRSPAIEDYALIGDCHTAALVSRSGAIDWLCWPRFDSPAVFAALLGSPANGCWCIAPLAEAWRVSRRYLPGTLILETTFHTPQGSVALLDFMVPGRDSVVRIVAGRSGRVAMHLTVALRFGYGSSVPWVTQLGHRHGFCAIAGPDQVVLQSDVPLRPHDLTHTASFDVAAGQRVRCVLTHGASFRQRPHVPDPDAALAETEAFWTEWSGRCTYHGPFREPVLRSLITLKALSYAPTGGIVAAPTTSLPEKLGGGRNWDYRYCWLRDATFTLMALMHCGYHEEARAWGAWLRRSVAGTPSQVQTLYGLAGERWIMEWEVPWLCGYQGSRPVRVGNAASGQTQLDVYGEVLDALYQEVHGGLVPPGESWDMVTGLVGHLAEIWQQPDESIWEVRGGARHFTFSKAMAWVAVDRAVRAAEEFGLDGPLAEWRTLRDEIHATVCRDGFNGAKGAFVQYFGGDSLDASLLLLPLVGFLPAGDPRMRATIEAVGRELTVDGLVQRYLTHDGVDGLPPGEGVFLACSFWYVDCLVLLGRHAAARGLFRRLLALGNDLGLLAEEYDPVAHRQLGNFPQAFSHLAVINAALNLQNAHGPAHRRSKQD